MFMKKIHLIILSLKRKFLSETFLWKRNLHGYSVRIIFRLKWKLIDKIPKSEFQWRAITEHYIDDEGNLKPGFFVDKRGLSSDIAIFSSKRKTRLGYGSKPRPINTGLAQFTGEDVSDVSEGNVEIKHDPKKEIVNYSHSIFSQKITEGQAKKLAKKANIIIKYRTSC